MREIEYCRKCFETECGNSHEIVYYITVDDVLGNDQIVFENYGVGVKLENGEDEKIRGVTIYAKKIEMILEFIANGTVTPVALKDVLYDLLELTI